MSYKTGAFKGTILFGVLGAIFSGPLNLGLSFVFKQPLPFRFTIILLLFAYGFYLAKQANKKSGPVLFPLALLFIVQFYIFSQNAFLVLTLAMLTWIRSGMFFPSGPFRILIRETITSFGGGLLIYYFNPHSFITWSLAIWLFFLIQSLFFLFSKDGNGLEKDKGPHDPFERAKKQVEKILDPI